MKDTKRKNQAGITLIALIVTIIVLIILAGVAISMLSGDSGILNRASEASVATEISGFKERVSLAQMSSKANISSRAMTEAGYTATTNENMQKIATDVAKEFGIDNPTNIKTATGASINTEGYTVAYAVDTEGVNGADGQAYIAIWYTSNKLRGQIVRDTMGENYNLADIVDENGSNSRNEVALVSIIYVSNYSSEIVNLEGTNSITSNYGLTSFSNVNKDLSGTSFAEMSANNNITGEAKSLKSNLITGDAALPTGAAGLTELTNDPLLKKNTNVRAVLQDTATGNKIAILKGLYYTGGTIGSGVVVSTVGNDSMTNGTGNQYVWIPVPNDGTGPNYTGAGVTSGDDTDKIYNALNEYSGETRTDDWSTASGQVSSALGMDLNGYNTFKKNILKSIYDNGGFYVGRYETGYETGAIRASSNTTNTAEYVEETLKKDNPPVIKRNAYPYNNVTCYQAQGLAKTFSTSNYSSSLMLGVQWELMLKYIGRSYASTTDWGNINGSTLKIDTTGAQQARIIFLDLGSFSPIAKDTNKTGTALLTTGASDTANKKNIYDVLGNLNEWTAECNTSNAITPCVNRGGHFFDTDSASFRNNYDVTNASDLSGFRCVLY